MSKTDGAGRYQRSTNGLLVAMLVTVGVVLVLALLRNLLSADLEVEVTEVDYLEKVTQAQGAGLEPVYPPGLPDGWRATGAEVTPGQPPGFGLSLLTDDDEFVGVRQEDDSVDDLLDEYVVERTEEGEPFEVSGSVASSWDTYRDNNGDLAYAAEVGEMTVLVYGSAGSADLESVVAALTTRPVPASAPSP